MTAVKMKFRPAPKPDAEGSLLFIISHNGRQRCLPTPYHILPSEWDSRRNSLVSSSHLPHRRLILDNIRSQIRTDQQRLNRIISLLRSLPGPFSANDIISEFHRRSQRYSLFNYMAATITNLRLTGHLRTSETYASTLNSFRRFRGNLDIPLDSLTPEILEAYQSWHLAQGHSPNTISFYNRILRAIYNRALAEDAFDDLHPFRRVFTANEKTRKRALPISIIRKIRTLDLRRHPRLDYARDMFMLSFYLRGMSFIDMAYLKKSDLRQCHITYRRRKTGRKLTILWTREMQSLLNKYPSNQSPYLLPLIRKEGLSERSAYRNLSYNINRSLKKIAAMLGLDVPLTMYVARHSWATAAREKGVPLSIISEGMGHESEATTRIYLATLDTSAIDRANALILRSI